MTLKILIKKTFNFFLKGVSKIVLPDDRIWLFGSWFGFRFSDNSRYLFLYAIKNKEKLGLKKVIWVTRSLSVYHELKNHGFDVHLMHSLGSIWFHFKAGIHFFDQDINRDLNSKYSIGSTKINLWHGFPLKKIGNYIEQEKKIFEDNVITLGECHKYSLLATSDLSSKILGYAFNKKNTDIIRGAYPRNSYLLSDEAFLLSSEKLLIEQILNLKRNGNKIIFYLPTFRDNSSLSFLGENSRDEKIRFLDKISSKYTIITKVHFGNKLLHGSNDFNGLNVINLPEEFDVYTLLKHTDILITDYSSVFFDFLYIDRPIIFYPYDLEYYQNEDRGLIFNYEDYTPGPKVYNLIELEKYLMGEELCKDKYKEMRNKIRKEVFSDTVEDLICSINKLKIRK